MKVYDSYTQELRDFVPLEGNKVKMYVCGPTVYDYPHLGHARCYITWDMVVKYLRFRGYDVVYARNITDVDDKIINKAKEQNKTTDEIASTYYALFKEAMHKLNVADPDIEPKATENIPEMIDMVQTLIDKDYAYVVDGDVYFRVKKFQKYGKLSKQSISELEAGARVEASDIKEDPLDFALWKAVKNDSEISWDSPWGKGRPGWHLECSAMSRKYLGDTIDIHAGGQDLLFPHHENEIAQSECACGCEFVKYWLHNGFVTINSEKMSKSLRNYITIQDLLEKYDSNTIRFFILTNHYRMPVEFNDESLSSAKAGVRRFKNAITDVENKVSAKKVDEAVEILSAITKEIAQAGKLPFSDVEKMKELEALVPAEIMESIVSLSKSFISSMDDDFNTSKALACLFEIASLAQKAKDSDNPESGAFYAALLIILSEVLGFDLRKTEALDDGLASKLIDLIISVRNDARAEKNWAMSDKIRDELKNLGIALKDSKEGTTWSFEDK